MWVRAGYEQRFVAIICIVSYQHRLIQIIIAQPFFFLLLKSSDRSMIHMTGLLGFILMGGKLNGKEPALGIK